MDDIGQLIRYAGEREQASAERVEKARANVGEHWQGIVLARREARRKVRFNQFAIAASLVVAIGIAFVLLRLPGDPAAIRVATADRVLGDVLIDGVPVDAGTPVGADAVIETRIGGRLAVALESGQSLRLDSNTQLVAHDDNRFVLEAGRVYFDSNRLVGAEPVFIETPYGTATDVGTQFMVSVESGYLSVGVREGEVHLSRERGEPVTIHDDSLFEIGPDGDERLGDLASTDPRWDWAASVAPEFDIDGVTLMTYLEWYARERGLKLDWADTRSKAYAERAVLSGSIKGLSLEEGLEVVRRIAPFGHQVSGDILIISAE